MHECSAGDPLDIVGVRQRMGQSGLELELEDNPNVMSMMVHVINYLFFILRFTESWQGHHHSAWWQLLRAHNSPSATPPPPHPSEARRQRKLRFKKIEPDIKFDPLVIYFI